MINEPNIKSETNKLFLSRINASRNQLGKFWKFESTAPEKLITNVDRNSEKYTPIVIYNALNIFDLCSEMSLSTFSSVNEENKTTENIEIRIMNVTDLNLL